MAHPLSPGLFKLGHYAAVTFRANVPSGTTLEDVLDPHFWAHVAHEVAGLKGKGHKIEVLSDDGELDVDLRILKAGERMVSVKVIRASIAAVPAVIPDDKVVPRIEFVPRNGWRVIDLQGGVFADKIEGKAKAEELLAEYRSQARIAA